MYPNVEKSVNVVVIADGVAPKQIYVCRGKLSKARSLQTFIGARVQDFLEKRPPSYSIRSNSFGRNKEQLERSPFLERLKKKNVEVILLTDPDDEYLMQYLMDLEDKKFQNVSKEGVKTWKGFQRQRNQGIVQGIY
ncbi:endoplasmin [Tanacetum coccineum]